MNDLNTDGKPISENVFRRLVVRLSAQQLRDLPVDCLPRSIPFDAVDPHADPAKYAVLNELAWTVGARELERRCEAADRLAPETREALEAAEAATARPVAELDRMTERVSRAWRDGDFRGDALSESSQMLERGRARAGEIGEQVGCLHRALAVLDRPWVADNALLERISTARQHARAVLHSLEGSLGRYELLEVDITQGDMRARQAQCNLELSRFRELDDKIAIVEEKLRTPRQLLRRLISPRVARQEREYLQRRLDTLIRKRDSIESFVSEDDLMHWLDVLVNASLHVPQDQWRERAQRTRLLLYRLMNVYCLQQEMAAHHVAVRATPGVNARQAIGYYLKSERFILNYFARKRQEVTLWLSGAADEKLGRLDQVRDAILADYRRNAQRGSRDATAASKTAQCADAGLGPGAGSEAAEVASGR
ncbi:MAG: hypothetical protein V5A42_02935 [Halofilum sp. (in: g-proteobacteria)]